MPPQLNEIQSDKELVEVPQGIIGQDVSTNLRTADIGTDLSYTHKIIWIKLIVFIAHHTAAFIGLFWVFTFQVHPLTTIYLIILATLQLFGLTMGVHRYFSHRSFKANTTLRRILFILYVLNGHYSLRTWVQHHRLHHKYSDTDGDPHNATRGLTFSQFGWYLCEPHPKVIRHSNGIDMSDVDADPWIMFEYNNFLKVYCLQLTLTCIFPIILWNESAFTAFYVCYATRTFMGLHMISTVNSLAHKFGYRPYDKSLSPAQNKFVAYVAFGEGWHNFHHSFPWDYRASELGTTFSWTSNMIDFCAKMGWAYDCKTATDKTIMSRIIRTGDNSHEKYRNVLKETELD